MAKLYYTKCPLFKTVTIGSPQCVTCPGCVESNSKDNSIICSAISEDDGVLLCGGKDEKRSVKQGVIQHDMYKDSDSHVIVTYPDKAIGNPVTDLIMEYTTRSGQRHRLVFGDVWMKID